MSIFDSNPFSPARDASLSSRRREACLAACSRVLAIGVAWLLTTLVPLAAHAVLIATGDGTGNTTAPAADPGFDNVGTIEVFSGVYIRNGWVLTAGHVGDKPITLLGVTYDPVPGSRVQFSNGDMTQPDLIAWKILDAKPALPDLAITDSPTTVGTDVTLIGHGLNRGIPLTHAGVDGFDHAVGWTMRWGTNTVSGLGLYFDPVRVTTTAGLAMAFDDIASPAPGEHEAAVAHGDSGGAAFKGSGASAELVGILFAQLPTLPGQPAGASFYTNEVLAVDLWAYRSDIVALIDQPGCSDGLDDDGDGLVDFPTDPGCANALDADERGPDHVCDNGVDDDEDGQADYPNDTTCASPTGDTEGQPPQRVPTASLGAGALIIALTAQAQRMLRRNSVHID